MTKEGMGGEEAVTSDLTRATDAELLDEVGRLNTEALGELYRRHAAAVFVVAYQLVGDVHAEEATKDVFLYVWDHPDELLATDTSLRAVLLDQLRLRHLGAVDDAHPVAEDRQLTHDERATLELALQGLGYREAAARLNLPSAVVDGLLRSALHKVYEVRAAPTEDSSEPV